MSTETFTVYRTSSNYFQTQFVSFFNKLINFETWDKSENGRIRFGETWANALLDKFELQQSENALFSKFIEKDKLSKFYGKIKIDKIVAVTLSSHVLAEEIRDLYSDRLNLNQFEEPELVKLTNYYEFYTEEPFNQIKSGENVLMVNDVISTGKLNRELFRSLTSSPINANVVGVFSLVDTRMEKYAYYLLPDTERMVTHYYDKEIDNKLVCILNHYVAKYKKAEDIPSSISNGRRPVEVKINPVLNAPTPRTRKSEQVVKKIIYNGTDQKDGFAFLRNIFDSQDAKDSLCVRHIENHNSHHPYFIDTKKLFQSITGKDIISGLINDVKKLDNEIATKRNRTNLSKIHDRFRRFKNDNSELTETETQQINSLLQQIEVLKMTSDSKDKYDFFKVDFIVHASDSGFDFIKRADFAKFLKAAGSQKDFQLIRMPRVMMSQELGIPNIPDSYKHVFENKRVLILDSASCTGETLLNLIDSMCYVNVKKITALSVITRIKDSQGEFLTRIHKINNNKNEFGESSIPIDIYFGAHFNLPFYLANSNQCPHCKEIHDYKEILYKTNPPKSVEDCIRYSRKFLGAVKINEISEGVESNMAPYLPAFLDISVMFQIRDELGKKEYQRAFNKYFKTDFISTIDNDSVDNIDEFIAVLLHEPHLIAIIKMEYKQLYFKLKIIVDFNTVIFIEETEKNRNFRKNLRLTWDRTSLLFVYSFFFEDEFFMEGKRNIHGDILLDKNFLTELIKYSQRDLNSIKSKDFSDVDSPDNDQCLNYVSYLIWIRQVHENIDQKNTEELDNKSQRLFHILNDLRNNSRDSFLLPANRLINKLVFKLSLIRASSGLKNKEMPFQDAIISLNKIYTEIETEGSNHYNLFGKLNSLKKALQDFNIEEIKLLWKKELYFSLEEIKNIAGVMKPLFEAYKESQHKQYLFDSTLSLYSFIAKMEDCVTMIECNNDVKELIDLLYYEIIELINYFFRAGSKFYKFALDYKSDIVLLWEKRLKSIKVSTGFNIEPSKSLFFKAPPPNLTLYLSDAIADYIMFYQLEINLNSYAQPRSTVFYGWEETSDSYILSIQNKIKKSPDTASIRSSFNGTTEWKKVLPAFGIHATTNENLKTKTFETQFKILKKFIVNE